MKIWELQKELAHVDPCLEVVLSRDAEGNGYSPLYAQEEAIYTPDTAWSGDATALGPEDKPNAVVLIPTN